LIDVTGRHCERSEAIQRQTISLDCFVANAPRNDGGDEKGSEKMTGAETLDVARDAIWTLVVVSSPLMVVGLVVGVVVSLFQALTQIQEQTLVFVPKILAIFITLILALPFMADSLHGQMMRISSRIIGG
jgi:flagellar biosynthesis protein FliQ